MNWRWCLIPLVFFFLAGCGTRHVWQDDKKIVPVTYQLTGEQSVQRSIGRLRRLVVLPAEIQLTGHGPVLAALGDEITPNQILDAFAKISAAYLANTKGYELAELQPVSGAMRDGMLAENLRIQVRTLLSWAAESADGASPPDEVTAAASTLGNLANVDGILLLQGWGETLSDEAYLAVLATAGLAWPLIFAETKVELSADLYEVSSGKIVWRSRATSTNQDNLHDIRYLAWDLLRPIEDALPGIFVAK